MAANFIWSWLLRTHTHPRARRQNLLYCPENLPFSLTSSVSHPPHRSPQGSSSSSSSSLSPSVPDELSHPFSCLAALTASSFAHLPIVPFLRLFFTLSVLPVRLVTEPQLGHAGEGGLCNWELHRETFVFFCVFPPEGHFSMLHIDTLFESASSVNGSRFKLSGNTSPINI